MSRLGRGSGTAKVAEEQTQSRRRCGRPIDPDRETPVGQARRKAERAEQKAEKLRQRREQQQARRAQRGPTRSPG